MGPADQLPQGLFDELLGAATLPLSPADIAALDAASAEFGDIMQIVPASPNSRGNDPFQVRIGGRRCPNQPGQAFLLSGPDPLVVGA